MAKICIGVSEAVNAIIMCINYTTDCMSFYQQLLCNSMPGVCHAIGFEMDYIYVTQNGFDIIYVFDIFYVVQ